MRDARERSAHRDPAPINGSSPTRASIRLLPKGTKFTPIAIYELWYEATEPKVLGIGYAATRDLVSFLRYEKRRRQGHAPIRCAERARGIRHALAFGVSQSGRYPAPLSSSSA